MPEDILNARFPGAVRGYERGAVDAYRNRVSRVVAELRMSASPRATVRHALDQAGQQVQGLLQSARETAEEITASARREAEESTARAKAEAAELVVHASAAADRVRAQATELIASMRAEADALAAKGKAEADEIRASARAEAANIIAGSRREADERRQQLAERLALLRDEAETRMREIQAIQRRRGRNAASCSTTYAAWPGASEIRPMQPERGLHSYSPTSPRRTSPRKRRVGEKIRHGLAFARPCERMLEDMLRPIERADRGRLESEPSAMR